MSSPLKADRKYYGRVLCTFAALLATSAGAAEMPESVLACQDETDDAKRLACFDREVRRHATTPEQRFGLPSGRAPAAKEDEAKEDREQTLRNITAKVTAISRRPRGEHVLTLDNGQVWAQTQAGSNLRVELGDSVTIRSAVLGSFLLTGPRGGSTRVERLR